MIELFNTILVNPIINVLVGIYTLLTAAHIPYALGFSIIILTVIIRLLLYPIMASQLRVQKKMQTLSPHLANLKEKHKGDAQRLQQETMALYKEHGVNPASGCLPALVQLPIIWALYGVLRQVVGLSSTAAIAKINHVLYFPFLKLSSHLDLTFFGISLGKDPSHLLATVGPFILLVPVITGLLQFVQSRIMYTTPPKKVVPAKDKDKKAADGDFASALQTQSLYFVPLMIGFFSYTFPMGLSLYWNTFTIFGIIQQYRMQGWGGLEPWLARLRPSTPVEPVKKKNYGNKKN